MSENIYKEARLRAAEENEELKTLESAHEVLLITKEKLGQIEQTDPKKKMASPNPDDVASMARVYNAPELCYYYCSSECPIGAMKRGDGEVVLSDNLAEISTSLMSALHFLDRANDEIHRILADSTVSDDERTKFREIMKTLSDISSGVQSLEIWAKRHGIM
jgi:hypothetical protein